MELVGYALPVNAAPCDMARQYLPLTLYLRNTKVGASDHDNALLFVHLMLPDMQLQDNRSIGAGYPLPLWRSDDIVDDRRGFSLPATLTPGKAFFETGLFWLSADGAIRRGDIVDDQGRIVQSGLDSRQAAGVEAEAIITDRVSGFMHWLESRDTVPTIRALRDAGERARRHEVEHELKLLARGEDPAKVLDAMSHGLTNKLLHPPTQALNQAEGDERDDVSALIFRIYRLNSGE